METCLALITVHSSELTTRLDFCLVALLVLCLDLDVATPPLAPLLVVSPIIAPTPLSAPLSAPTDNFEDNAPVTSRHLIGAESCSPPQ